MLEALEPAHWWLIAAGLFFAIEAFGIQGIGFLFAGFAAVITGALVEYEVIGFDDYIAQTAAWMALTAVFTALLWKRLKSWRVNPDADDHFSNMVGDEATVLDDGLHISRRGRVKWSGTTMVAEISEAAGVEKIEEGTIVTVVSVKGNCLIVAPRA